MPAHSTRRIFRAVAKTVTIPIEVERGGEARVVDFVGYHRDAPEVWNQIQVQAAWDAWDAASYVENVQGVEVVDPATGQEAVPEKILRESPVAEATLRRDLLTAVLRDPETGEPMTERDADVLARNGGDWLPILRELGWWGDAPAEATSRPEAGGEGAPTGDASSPAPAPSTAADTTG
jgi:hypothetical protein